MVDREQLVIWVHEALTKHGGRAKVVDVAKSIWKHHENELRASKDLFFTWQYDMRWAALKLRKKGAIKPADLTPRGVWELAK